MIYAENFIASEICRNLEFTSDVLDFPIMQFAAKTPEDFADAAEIVYGLVFRPINYFCFRQASGIDLNCGCPKGDVRKEGYGSKLLDNPQLIYDIVKQTRARISDPYFTVSIKIRVSYPLEYTIDLCRKIEFAGVDHIAVHARTVAMRKEPADYEAIKLIKSSLSIPVFANGGCTSYEQALDIVKMTGADGLSQPFNYITNVSI